MNGKRWLVAGVAAFAVVAALDWLIHAGLLGGLYEQTRAVWRPHEQVERMMGLMTLNQLLFGLAFAWFYTLGYEPAKGGLGQGIRFGLFAAVFLIAEDSFAWYVVLAIPFALNVGWWASVLANCLAAGAAVGLIYRK